MCKINKEIKGTELVLRSKLVDLNEVQVGNILRDGVKQGFYIVERIDLGSGYPFGLDSKTYFGDKDYWPSVDQIKQHFGKGDEIEVFEIVSSQPIYKSENIGSITQTIEGVSNTNPCKEIKLFTKLVKRRSTITLHHKRLEVTEYVDGTYHIEEYKADKSFGVEAKYADIEVGDNILIPVQVTEKGVGILRGEASSSVDEVSQIFISEYHDLMYGNNQNNGVTE